MRTLFLRLSVVLAIVVIGATLWGTRSLDEMPASSQAIKVVRRNPVPVKVWETEIEDNSRATAPHRNFAGAPTRKMTIRVWEPETTRPSPLIVYSHGFGGNRDDLDYLLWELAAQGFVCVAPSFPSTNTFAPGGPLLGDVVNQPRDQSFVIDHMLSWNTGKIDPARIGAIGMSLGGLTTTLLAFDPNRHDTRISAAVSVAGLHHMFTREYYTRAVPFMEIAGTKDAVVPFTFNAQVVPSDISGATLVAINGGTHAGFAQIFAKLRFMSHADTVACWFVMRNIEDRDRAGWIKGLGASAGVRDVEAHACEQQFLTGPTMDPRQQQRIASVAAAAFFQSELASDPLIRSENRAYLKQGLTRDFSEVSVSP